MTWLFSTPPYVESIASRTQPRSLDDRAGNNTEMPLTVERHHLPEQSEWREASLVPVPFQPESQTLAFGGSATDRFASSDLMQLDLSRRIRLGTMANFTHIGGSLMFTVEPTSILALSDTSWRVSAIQAAIDCDPQLTGASVSVSKFAGAIWLSGTVKNRSMVDHAVAVASEIANAPLRHSLVIIAEPNASRA